VPTHLLRDKKSIMRNDRERCNPIVVTKVMDYNMTLSYTGDIIIIKFESLCENVT
jgi:hypothetical protein